MSSEQTPGEQLQALEERLHIYEGLVRVFADPHMFVDIVLSGDDVPGAVVALQKAFGFSEVQASAALDMQFRRLGNTTQSRMRADLDEMRLKRQPLRQS